MMSIQSHGQVAAVVSYYTSLANYYVGAEGAREKWLATWHGKAAERLGLSGTVDKADFKEILSGRLPDGTALGTMRGGELKHHPSWDATLSAPKSVSILALVGRDERLVEAHDKAAAAALNYLEDRVAETRIRRDGNVEYVRSGNLAFASLRERTSREGDPQLHTHNVIANVTFSEGKWRSLEGRSFYQARMAAGQLYQNELALQCRAAGYELEHKPNGFFEIAGVPKAVLSAFGKRSEQIRTELENKGLKPEQASAAERRVAALASRSAKEHSDVEQLRSRWDQECRVLGFDAKDLVSKSRSFELVGGSTVKNDASASLCVESAVRSISENSARFDERDLIQEALKRSVGVARFQDVERAVADAESRGLVIRCSPDRGTEDMGRFTTREGIDLEKKMLRLEFAGRGNVAPLLSGSEVSAAVVRYERQGQHPWNEEHRRAVTSLFKSPNRINAIQGSAGTAKTTNVVAAIAKEAERQGCTVVALAPTADAAGVLGDAIGQRANTVSRHLLMNRDGKQAQRGFWIVDEASLLSTRDMTALLDSSERSGARVLLVGDVDQLSSVSAGVAFRQLQEAGMSTSRLTQIVRQESVDLQSSVYSALQGDIRGSLASLDRSGGRVVELNDPEFRYAAMAEQYLKLSAAERARSLLLEPSVDGRERLTTIIREQLQNEGTLKGERLKIESLERKAMSAEDLRLAASYEVGDVVRFSESKALEHGAGNKYFSVKSKDSSTGRIRLVDVTGNEVNWTPVHSSIKSIELYSPRHREIMEGDRLVWTRNDYAAGRLNGRAFEVEKVSTNGTAVVRDASGTSKSVDFSGKENGHFRHAYVQTAYAAQGKTVDHVIAHAESFRTNLVHQKSFYVAVSRAKVSASIYTDDREALVRGIEERTGEKDSALGLGGDSHTSGGRDTTDQKHSVDSPSGASSVKVAREGVEL